MAQQRIGLPYVKSITGNQTLLIRKMTLNYQLKSAIVSTRHCLVFSTTLSP